MGKYKITLTEFIKLVPEHAKIGIVVKLPDDGKIEKYHTLYSGHKYRMNEFCKLLETDTYVVRNTYSSVWNNSCGLVIQVVKRGGVWDE